MKFLISIHLSAIALTLNLLSTSHASDDLSLFEEKDASPSDFCDQRADGTYADVESDCHKFFVCEKRHQYKFSCPSGSRFFQRFEECSFVPPEEEASFNCNEMTEAAHIGSQSLQMDDAMKETHAYETIKRMDDVPVREKKALNPEAIETREQLGEYLKAVLQSSPHHSVTKPEEGNERHQEQPSPDPIRKQQAMSPCEAFRLGHGSRIRRHVPCV